MDFKVVGSAEVVERVVTGDENAPFFRIPANSSLALT